MTVKDLPHNLAFTVALATEGAVCSGVRGSRQVTLHMVRPTNINLIHLFQIMQT